MDILEMLHISLTHENLLQALKLIGLCIISARDFSWLWTKPYAIILNYGQLKKYTRHNYAY